MSLVSSDVRVGRRAVPVVHGSNSRPLPSLNAVSCLQLVISRAVTGIAIGGGLPLLYSVLGDAVGAARRTEAVGAITISITLGAGVGQVSQTSPCCS